MTTEACCVLSGGGGAWAFDALARRLSAALWVGAAEAPRSYNYLLQVEGADPEDCGELFIPVRAMRLAADKRLLAEAFAAGVPTPETHLIGSLAEASGCVPAAPGVNGA